MALIFATGPEDTGAIVELAARSPSLRIDLLHLSPKNASRRLQAAGSKDVVATIALTQRDGEAVRFPYPPAFFSRFRPDLFIILETSDGDLPRQRLNTHMALSTNPAAVKIIKVDRNNIKDAILEIRKALLQVLGG